MGPERWKAVKAVFEAVVDLDPSDATAYLDHACANDAELRTEVESLLLAHHGAGDFIEAPAQVAQDIIAGVSDDGPKDELIGASCGPYRIIREIARGGMGAVYEGARSDDVYDQRVAIKVVHTGMRAGTFVQRFRNERQILANLDHPNIARLVDGGSLPGGRPYFVMEYVDGTPIDQYCSRLELSLNDRLRLFHRVATAVHHAHQRLVIHRDIKPTNVLVTSDGAPKLLDFGIAKVLDQALIGGVTLTMEAHPMTPAYASPEQVRGEALTTATDVYSLGVLLYELLTGRGPYTLSTHHAKELADAICEAQPPKPSTVIEASLSPDSREPSLSRRLKGDLDNIVLKALHKEPQKRYPSAQEFAADIDRYLQGKPVAARPDTLLYRTGKFARRHKAGVTLAGTAVVLLVIAFIVTISQYQVAQRERDRAQLERDRAQRRFNDVRQLANTFMFDINDSISRLPGSTPARERLVETALRYLDSLYQESSGDSQLERELAAAYERVAAIQSTIAQANTGNRTGAIANRRKAVALRESRVRANPADLEAQLDWAGSLGSLASIIGDTDTKTAIDMQRQVVKISESADTKSRSRRSQSAVEISHYYLGGLLLTAGDIPGALAEFNKNIELMTRRANDEPDNLALHGNIALTDKRVGGLLGQNGQLDEAFVRYRRALETEQAILQSNPISVDARRAISVTHSDLAWLYSRSGDNVRAIESYRKAYEIRKALADADPSNADMKALLATTLSKLGALTAATNADEARTLHRQVLALREENLQRDPANADAIFDVATAYSDLARLAFAQEEFAESAEYYSKTLEVVTRLSNANPLNRQYKVHVAGAILFVGAARLAIAERTAGGAQCDELTRARSLLVDALAKLQDLKQKGQLLQFDGGADVGSIQFGESELRKADSRIRQLRTAGVCGESRK